MREIFGYLRLERRSENRFGDALNSLCRGSSSVEFQWIKRSFERTTLWSPAIHLASLWSLNSSSGAPLASVGERTERFAQRTSLRLSKFERCKSWKSCNQERVDPRRYNLDLVPKIRGVHRSKKFLNSRDSETLALLRCRNAQLAKSCRRK